MPTNRVSPDHYAECVRKGLTPPLAAVARQAAMAPHTLSIGPITLAERWVVTIPRYHPVPLNDLIGRSPMAIHRVKSRDARRIGDEMALAGVPRATGKRRLTLRIILGPRMKGCDGDAYFKVLLDSLVACGRLVNDSRAWVELPPVEFERGKAKASVITLEDV